MPSLIGGLFIFVFSGTDATNWQKAIILGLLFVHFGIGLFMLKNSKENHYEKISVFYPTGFINRIADIIHNFILGFASSWISNLVAIICFWVGLWITNIGISSSSKTKYILESHWLFAIGFIAGFWLVYFGTKVFRKPDFNVYTLTKKLGELIRTKKKTELKPLPSALRTLVPSSIYYLSHIGKYIGIVFYNYLVILKNTFRLQRLLMIFYPLSLILDFIREAYNAIWWSAYISINRILWNASGVFMWITFIAALGFNAFSLFQSYQEKNLVHIFASILVFILSFTIFMGFRFFRMEIHNPLNEKTP